MLYKPPWLILYVMGILCLYKMLLQDHVTRVIVYMVAFLVIRYNYASKLCPLIYSLYFAFAGVIPPLSGYMFILKHPETSWKSPTELVGYMHRKRESAKHAEKSSFRPSQAHRLICIPSWRLSVLRFCWWAFFFGIRGWGCVLKNVFFVCMVKFFFTPWLSSTWIPPKRPLE